jgi:hypothetical protein
MANENPNNQAEAAKPLPHCKAFLLCEGVAEDQVTGAISLLNLIDVMRLSSFPATSESFVVFLQLYDGIGRYTVSLELHDLADDRVAKATYQQVDFPNRLDKLDLLIPIATMRLPRPGRYEWVALVDGKELATQYFDAEIDNGKEETA